MVAFGTAIFLDELDLQILSNPGTASGLIKLSLGTTNSEIGLEFSSLGFAEGRKIGELGKYPRIKERWYSHEMTIPWRFRNQTQNICTQLKYMLWSDLWQKWNENLKLRSEHLQFWSLSQRCLVTLYRSFLCNTSDLNLQSPKKALLTICLSNCLSILAYTSNLYIFLFIARPF